MFPHFDLFGKTISLYSLIAVVGVFIVGFIVCLMVRKSGKDDTDAVIVLLIAAVGVIIGSHLLYALTNLRYFSLYSEVDSFGDFLEISKMIFGGAVFYGGLIGGIATGYIALRFVDLDKKDFCDIMAFGTPLFHGISRIGCFMGGCCYGIESDFGFAAHGNDWVTAVNDVTRFPVQLLESFCCFMIALLVYLLYRKKMFQGKLFLIYLAVYSVVRFLDEYLRGDEIRGFVGPLSTSQFISVLIFAVSVPLFIISYKKEKTAVSPEATK